MKSFKFQNPVTAICGDDALDALERVAQGKRVLLVSGAGSAKRSGSLDAVMGALSAAGASVGQFAGITQCTYERIVEGTRAARESNAEMVVGLGGASVMDTAKAIAFCALHDDYDDYLTGKLEQHNDEKLWLVLIPTYPSTGSEANGVSDIMGYAGGIHGVFADYALLYPPFTFSLDARNTAFSTMVLLAQTGYRYFTDANPISRGFTAASLRAVLGAYPVLLEEPENADARQTMLWASFLETSGLLGLGMEGNWTYSIFSAAGLLRFTLGTVYRENLAMVYPRWLVFAARHHPDQVREFAVSIMGADPDASVEDAVRFAFSRVMGILRSGGLPLTLEAYGEMPTDEAIAEATNKVSSKEFSVDEYIQMIRACGTEGFPGL
ncbi:MAG: iron-containing alcohol dehydrogenase [Eggerthellaceae bacterium]|nr:iron-containing alcohol dehydrogenase [Eggerthellaceae bacterium]